MTTSSPSGFVFRCTFNDPARRLYTHWFTRLAPDVDRRSLVTPVALGVRPKLWVFGRVLYLGGMYISLSKNLRPPTFHHAQGPGVSTTL